MQIRQRPVNRQGHLSMGSNHQLANQVLRHGAV